MQPPAPATHSANEPHEDGMRVGYKTRLCNGILSISFAKIIGRTIGLTMTIERPAKESRAGSTYAKKTRRPASLIL